MKIGELSRRTGVPSRMLRYYEEQDLLHPERADNGYRSYGASAVHRVQQIRGLLDSGLTTEIIRRILPFLGEPDEIRLHPECLTPKVAGLLRGEAERIQQRIDCLARNRDAIHAYLAAAGAELVPVPDAVPVPQAVPVPEAPLMPETSPETPPGLEPGCGSAATASGRRSATAAPRRHQRPSRGESKGWRKPEGAVMIVRPNRWSNPYKLIEHGGEHTREQAVRLFEEDLVAGRLVTGPGRDPLRVEDARRELAGKDLVCACRPDQLCHGDVLLRRSVPPPGEC